MNLIELHILQSFPVTCLNRDDVGAPKSAVFGGAPRARVSSQCWKRAIRQRAAELRPESFAGQRGHYVAAKLTAILRELDVPEKQAVEASESICTFLGEHDKKKKDEHKTKVALYLSPGELRAIAEAIVDDLRESNAVKPSKGSVKKALNAAKPTDASDIAIFGRMVASDHSLMLEGAGLFSHALSTHRVSNEVDFFSAVDDLKPEESEGAGHIGTLEFNSACYYRYVGLNIDLLRDEDHLAHFEPDDFKGVVKTMLNAAIEAVPTARHNSMFGFTPPGAILGLARRGQPLSLANAFEKPVSSRDGYLEKSREALNDHYESLKGAFGVEATEEIWFPEASTADLIGGLLSHV